MMQPSTAARVAANSLKKGDVLGTARFAAIQAAKDAASYLPHCDPVHVHHVSVHFTLHADAIDVEATAYAETCELADMPALTAVTVAALTIYDMCKSADRTMVIGPVHRVPSPSGATDVP